MKEELSKLKMVIAHYILFVKPHHSIKSLFANFEDMMDCLDYIDKHYTLEEKVSPSPNLDII